VRATEMGGCSLEEGMQAGILAVGDPRLFEVRCKAGDAGQSCVGTALSIRVSQRVRRGGIEEMWVRWGSTLKRRKAAPLLYGF
jgi:hypothetical protein